MDELFNALEDRLRNPKPLLDKLGEQVLGSWRLSILSEGHGRFAPLADSTIRRKSTRGRLPVMLVDTGAMLASLIPGRSGNVFEVDGLTVEVGTTDEKAAYHVYGTDPHMIPNAWGRGVAVSHPGMPARDFTILEPGDLGLLADTTAAWVAGGAL